MWASRNSTATLSDNPSNHDQNTMNVAAEAGRARRNR